MPDNKPSPGARGKAHLPQKICLACGRPFVWRKKWRATWDDVKTCSERCRGALKQARRLDAKATTPR